MTAAKTLGTKGRATRQALEDAARNLFARRGFHGTTLADITSAAGKSPASFYRYFTDKEDLLAAIAEDFLSELAALPSVGSGEDFFTSAVSVYWEQFKPNIGIMLAVDQLSATETRFAVLQNRFRQFGMDIVAASVRRAQHQGAAGDLDPDHIALAIALLFERFTSVSLSHGLSDDAAVATLSTIWRNTVHGSDHEEIR